jgi:hypothetical protein
VILPFGCHSSTELGAAGGADVKDVGASTAGGAAKEAPGAPQVKTSSEPAVEVAATAAVDVAETEAALADATTTAAQRGPLGAVGASGHGADAGRRHPPIDGPLRTWVASVPQLSFEAQAAGEPLAACARHEPAGMGVEPDPRVSRILAARGRN